MSAQKLKIALTDVESWLEWQIRTMRKTKNVIEQTDMSIIGLLNAKRKKWMGRIARFGTGPRSMHMLKAVLCWRNLFWWKQQSWWNKIHIDEFRHVYFKPRRWEEQFPTTWLHACTDY